MTTPASESEVPLAAPGSKAGLQLSGMMLLQYAVWGIWMPYLSAYLLGETAKGGLGFSGNQVGWILGLAASIGALSAPFIAGQVADRYLNAERALAVLLALGGVLNLVLARTHGFMPFLVISVLYSVVYMPTLSLTNSIAFQNLSDTERRFPMVRLWGTIGWFVASTAFTKLWLNTADVATNTARIADALTLSGYLSLAYAAYALFVLPATPPRPSAEPLAFLKAFRLLRNPSFLLITLVALPIAMIHQVYFIRAPRFFLDHVGIHESNLGPVFGIGQASEVVFLFLLGLFVKRLGFKTVLITGCLAYAVRFGLFAIGEPPALVFASQTLHGLCYGWFFAASFLLVEKIASEDIRHSAQTVFGIIILGVGPILSVAYNGVVLEHFKGADGVHYAPIWWSQSAVALAAAAVLAVLFRYRPAPAAHDTTAAEHHSGHLA